MLREGRGNPFDVSDEEPRSEQQVRAEGKKAVERAKRDPALEEMHGMLDELQETQDVFQLAKESDREHVLTEKDIEEINPDMAEFEAAKSNIAKTAKNATKMPPPLPRATVARPALRSIRGALAGQPPAVPAERQPAPVPQKKPSLTSRISGWFKRAA